MGLGVFGDNSSAVDWWFIYKLPHGVKPTGRPRDDHQITPGTEYLSLDATSTEPLALSQYRLDQKKGAVFNTLKQLYSAKKSNVSSLGWITYNDEIPNRRNNDERKGHTKGVLAFDLKSETAFWLLHERCL